MRGAYELSPAAYWQLTGWRQLTGSLFIGSLLYVCCTFNPHPLNHEDPRSSPPSPQPRRASDPHKTLVLPLSYPCPTLVLPLSYRRNFGQRLSNLGSSSFSLYLLFFVLALYSSVRHCVRIHWSLLPSTCMHFEREMSLERAVRA